MRLLFPLALSCTVALAGCGSPEQPNNGSSNNGGSNNGSSNNGSSNNGGSNNGSSNNGGSNNGSSNNGVSNNGQSNNSTTGDSPVEVSCVSDLVTSGGNYYAVNATITGGKAEVEMAFWLAATPTSDPEEVKVWADRVEADFTPRVFAYQTTEQFLDVSKSDDERMYRGTMSGDNQLGDDVEVTCWPTAIVHPASYDAAGGGCLDAEQNAAMNDIPWMVALRTGFGQCATFDGVLNGAATGGPTFDFIDLRGADLSGATLRSATIARVQLEGASLIGITLEDATIEGTFDEHTELPDDCVVDEASSTFSCSR